MSAEENKAFIRRYFDAVARDKSAATVNQYIADSDEELKQHIAFYEAAFPGYQLTADHLITEGDQVAVRTTLKATHSGNLMGIPPTGKQVSVPFIIIYRVVDGKIVEHWMSFARLELMEQLGIAPPMGGGAE